MQETVGFYKENAKMLKKTFEELGFKVYGAVDAPYVWVNFQRKRLVGSLHGNFDQDGYRHHTGRWFWANRGWFRPHVRVLPQRQLGNCD